MGGEARPGAMPAESAYPHVAGFKARSTSRAAAIEITDDVQRLRRVVLKAIVEAGRDGLTAHEIAAKVDLPNTTTQPRTSELARLGSIADSGARRFNASGKRAIVWQVPTGKGTAHGERP